MDRLELKELIESVVRSELARHAPPERVAPPGGLERIADALERLARTPEGYSSWPAGEARRIADALERLVVVAERGGALVSGLIGEMQEMVRSGNFPLPPVDLKEDLEE